MVVERTKCPSLFTTRPLLIPSYPIGMRAHSESASLNYRYYLLAQQERRVAQVKPRRKHSRIAEHRRGLRGCGGCAPFFPVFRSPSPALRAPLARLTSHCACPIVSSLQGRIALRAFPFFSPCGISPFFSCTVQVLRARERERERGGGLKIAHEQPNSYRACEI